MCFFRLLSQTITLIGVVFLTGGLRLLFAFAFAFV
jgi:hypothetical protein